MPIFDEFGGGQNGSFLAIRVNKTHFSRDVMLSGSRTNNGWCGEGTPATFEGESYPTHFRRAIYSGNLYQKKISYNTDTNRVMMQDGSIVDYNDGIFHDYEEGITFMWNFTAPSKDCTSDLTQIHFGEGKDFVPKDKNSSHVSRTLTVDIDEKFGKSNFLY